MGEYIQLKSVQLLLPEADNLRLLTYRDLLPRLASPSPWVVPDKGAEVLEKFPLDPYFTVCISVCLSFLYSLAILSQDFGAQALWLLAMDETRNSHSEWDNPDPEK